MREVTMATSVAGQVALETKSTIDRDWKNKQKTHNPVTKYETLETVLNTEILTI